MTKEDYVSFEVAKLLKDKGFDELCNHYYFYKKLKEVNYYERNSDNLYLEEVEYCTAPTHQMTLKWLRGVHGIFIAINNDDLDFNWQCYDLINRGSTLDPKILSKSYAGYKTYEKAVEAALKYVLENLI